MEHSIHVERTIPADPIKPILRTRSIIYVIIVFSSIAFGAFGLAALYHSRELQVLHEQRFQIKHEQVAVKPAEFMLAKQRDATATNLENLLRLLKYATRSQDSLEKRAREPLNNEQESIKQKKEMDGSAGNDNQEVVRTYASQESPLVVGKDAAIVSSEVVSVQEEANLQDGSQEQKFGTGSVPSSEVFQWKWTFPSSAWLQLSPFMFNYEFDNASTDRSNSAME